MKNREHVSRYKPGHAGKSPLQITIAADRQGYWHGTVWPRGPLQCLFSTGDYIDQRDAHAAVQQWLCAQGYHSP